MVQGSRRRTIRRYTSLTFEALAAHDEVTLEFDLYVIGSWNGWMNGENNSQDRMLIAVEGGPELLHTSFSNQPDEPQNYPDPLGQGLNSPGTGASAIGALGYPSDDGAWGDATYSLSFTFDHTNPVLRFRFRSNTTSSGEAIGIDNVRFRTR